MRRSTLGASVALLLVFAAGVAGGVALERTWLGPESAEEGPDGRDRDDYPKPVIERFSEELELSAGQQARIDTIIGDLREEMKAMWAETRPRYRAMVDSAKARIEAVLNEEQVEKYRRLLEREAERHDRHWGRDSADGGERSDWDDDGRTDGAADGGERP